MPRKITTPDQVSARAAPNDESTVPSFYVDQPAKVMLGPFVSRLTFGVSSGDPDGYPSPVVSIAIPTASLSRFANDLKNMFDDPNYRRKAAEQLLKAAADLGKTAKGTPPDQLIIQQAAKRSRPRSIRGDSQG